jgi:hypothetical protein
LKRWFPNKQSELLRWHEEKHKKDAKMIRHLLMPHNGKTLIHEILNLLVVGMLAAATAGFSSVLTRPPAHAYLGNLASGPGWIRRRSGLLKLHQPDSSFEFPI